MIGLCEKKLLFDYIKEMLNVINKNILCLLPKRTCLKGFEHFYDSVQMTAIKQHINRSSVSAIEISLHKTTLTSLYP